MGQHAEDLINGDADFFTGEWLGDGQGFPQSEQFNNKKATKKNNFRGIRKYTMSKGVKKSRVSDVIEAFINDKHPAHSKDSLMDKSATISKNFKQYTSWLGINKNKFK